MNTNFIASLISLIGTVGVAHAALDSTKNFNMSSVDYAQENGVKKANDYSDEERKNSSKTIAEKIKSDPNLSTLKQALIAADLLNTFENQASYTLLAPNNKAFAALPAGTLDYLLKPENKEDLKNLLKYHVLTNKMTTDNLKSSKAKTLNGKDIDIEVMGKEVMINNAKVTEKDMLASNGTILVIDKVLMPKDDK